MGHNHFEIGNLVKETALDKADYVQATIVGKPQRYKEARAGQAVVIRRHGGMKMDRDSQPPNVLDNGAEFRGIEQLDAFQSQLVDAAIHFRDGALRIPKSNAPQSDKFSWVGLDDPRQVIVNTHGPLVSFLATQDIRSQRKTMAQHGDADLHLVHVAQFLFHIHHLRERGHLESWGTLYRVSTSFQQGLGQGIPTLQMLDKIQALKVGVYINTHFFLLQSPLWRGFILIIASLHEGGIASLWISFMVCGAGRGTDQGLP